MYKTFILAASIAVLPLSKYRSVSHADPAINNLFQYAYSFPEILQPALKKNAEPYSQNWATIAQENIRQSEYHFNWNEKLKAYSTPNRKNNLRFFYNDKGFSVEPRTTQIPLGPFDPLAKPHEIKYRNIPRWKVKFNLDKKQVGTGTWKLAANKAAYVTPNITVQYINNEEGMRQNFIVHVPITKPGTLRINFHIKTKLTIKCDEDQLRFYHKNKNVLNYHDLKVWDATGRVLPASFQQNKNKSYAIKVDDRNAVYPITIDPLSTTPAAIVESNQLNGSLGFSVSSAGDVNGDGYSDVVTGATGFDSGQAGEGAAFIFHGSATGISTTAAAIVQSNQVNARMGVSVSTAGDVNGDGYSDIITGAQLYDSGETDEGAAFVYHGSATGINTVAATMIQSDQASAQMGYSISLAGDVNSDGYSDIIVGSWLYDSGESNEGVAFVYHGSATGINNVAVTMMQSNQAGSNYGLSVAGAGDVNGDGYSDVIVGAEDYDNGQTDEGVFFVYHGSAAGINNAAVTMAESNQTLSQFAYSVATAGDVNGDGYADVIVGAYSFDLGEINEGVAFIYHGSAAGISSTAAANVQSNQAGTSLGVSVACAGDINGDGYSDIIAGAYLYDNGQTDEGGAFVYTGSATGINTVAAAIVESNQASANMGRSVAGAGDVNGDGYSDVMAGAPQYDSGETNEGAAFVYHGSPAGVNTTPAILVEGNQVNATMGATVAFAGDVNADGYGDIIVGASQYNNGQANEGVAFIYHGSATGISATPAAILENNTSNTFFGFSVAGAGDVNGDGYSDVIVGAQGFTNGENAEGAIYIYHGSPAGINTTAAVMIESNQVGGRLGYCVAGAGDVNGDGYSDVIAGARFLSNGQSNEGAFFIHHGSPAGIITTPASTVESNQVSGQLGVGVASAGDVNGDGFSDVIVGANGFTNGESGEGAAFVYHGSSTGINTTSSVMLESNQVDANFGFSVSGAGDVNGDGYSDVIVGANYYDNSEDNEGRAYVYHGSATGIGTTAAAIMEPNQANAEMGVDVACAGDVNGDGYSDVIVGAQSFTNGSPFEGAALIYHGSPTGISIVASAILEANPANTTLGWSVASAGDLNADGYSDVMASAWNYANGESGEGAFFVYHSNELAANKRNNLRLYNTDLITPINSSNFNFSNFGAGLYARSFLGRSKGKMVWETRLNYNTYSGTPITNSTFYTTQQATYSDLGLTGTELKDIISKISGGMYTKIRARIKYDPLTALTGQVYSPWRNVSSIIDANNLGVLPIELISFNAAWIQKGKTARLEFTTDKESGICCFDIERSVDGINYFPIGVVPAKNSSGIQSYSFIDGSATNRKQFYRLKIKGIAGQVEYSNIQLLQQDKSTEILVFPNPTTDKLHLQLNHAFNTVQVRIFSASGQLAKQLTLPVSNQTINIPVQNLAPGKYWLHLQAAGQKQVLQFVKQ